MLIMTRVLHRRVDLEACPLKFCGIFTSIKTKFIELVWETIFRGCHTNRVDRFFTKYYWRTSTTKWYQSQHIWRWITINHVSYMIGIEEKIYPSSQIMGRCIPHPHQPPGLTPLRPVLALEPCLAKSWRANYRFEPSGEASGHAGHAVHD
jgi:hypothetical protein